MKQLPLIMAIALSVAFVGCSDEDNEPQHVSGGDTVTIGDSLPPFNYDLDMLINWVWGGTTIHDSAICTACSIGAEYNAKWGIICQGNAGIKHGIEFRNGNCYEIWTNNRTYTANAYRATGNKLIRDMRHKQWNGKYISYTDTLEIISFDKRLLDVYFKSPYHHYGIHGDSIFRIQFKRPYTP